MLTGTFRAGVIAVMVALAPGLPVHAQSQPGDVQISPTVAALSFSKKLQLAKAGDEEAQLAVALAYDTGKDVHKNPVQAARWYRLAAQRGNAEAQFRLARLVQMGSRNLDRNLPLAAQLFEAAAKQGIVKAEYWTGYDYERGEGVKRDLAKAIEWYRKAADAGEARAGNNLGLIYLTGNGIARNISRSFHLFKAAADKGNSWAENNLGGMYEMGWGVAADKAEAVRLYRLAASKGNPHAAENLKRLGEPATAANSTDQPDQSQQN